MRTPTRTHQAEKQGQFKLSDWDGGTITDTITPTIKQRRGMVGLISTPIQSSLGPAQKPVKLLSVHKLPFVYTYEGTQPTRDAYSIRKLGRDGSGRQVYYWWDEEKAGIQVFRNCFMVWIKKPRGMKLDEQLGECRERADMIARKFGMKYGLGNIVLKSEPPTEACPDVIVEDKSVAKVLNKIAKAGNMPEGIAKNQTSHKGKWETNYSKGKKLEWVLDGGLEARFEVIDGKLDTTGDVLNRIAGILEKMFNGKSPGQEAPIREYDGRDYG